MAIRSGVQNAILSSRSIARIALSSVAIFTLSVTTAHAHEVNVSFSTVGLVRDNLTVVMRFTAHDAISAVALDTDNDGDLSTDELEAGLPLFAEYLHEHTNVRADDQGIVWQRPSWYVTKLLPDGTPADVAVSNDPLAHLQVSVELSCPLESPPECVEFTANFLEKLPPRHRHVLQFELADRSEQALLTADSRSATFDSGHGVPWWRQVIEYTGLGIEHIFLGYDHIMFLVGLVVVGGRWQSIVKTVTAFTVAHSITLILAALQVVSISSRWVESGIALSIAYVAVENLIVKEPRHRWMLAFVFGLVHGFGFAGVLAETGLPRKNLVAALLAFNLGVEIGQLAIVAALFPIVLWLSRTPYHKPVVIGVSSVILLFGLGWFVQRAFDLSFMPI